MYIYIMHACIYTCTHTDYPVVSECLHNHISFCIINISWCKASSCKSVWQSQYI